MINPRYTQLWVNRRSRRAWLSGRLGLHHYHYRTSWNRYVAWQGSPSLQNP